LKKRIRMGGVPEHFNMPWHLAIENGHFKKKNINFEWITFHGGTGQMRQALRNDETDACVILTEGIIADIVKGSPTKIVSHYINSPLIWGVHTGAKNSLNNYSHIYNQRYAISRFGSGSHLMAIVDAHVNKRELKTGQFVPVQNLDGAIDSLTALKTDVFYWEKFMTKPYVDSGQLKRLGEYLTPWPSFVIAVREDFLRENEQVLIDVLDVIRFNCQHFMSSPNSIDEVARTYGLVREDVDEWFHLTEWDLGNPLSEKMIENVQYYLQSAGIIEEELRFEAFLFNP